MNTLATRASGGYEATLHGRNALPIDAGVVKLHIPLHVLRVVHFKADATGVAVNLDRPNVTSNLSDFHNNLRPFKG